MRGFGNQVLGDRDVTFGENGITASSSPPPPHTLLVNSPAQTGETPLGWVEGMKSESVPPHPDSGAIETAGDMRQPGRASPVSGGPGGAVHLHGPARAVP